MKRLILVLVLAVAIWPKANAQVVFEHVSNTSIYEYLDEMANLKLIELNTGIKPYSKRFIMTQLDTIATKAHKLNKRQKKELIFFMKDYIRDRGPSSTSPRGIEIYPDSGYAATNMDFLGKGLKRGDVFPYKNREKRYDLFAYRSPRFSVSINPLLGGQGWVNSNGLNYHSYYGGELHGYAWKVGFYGNVRENFELKGISAPQYLTQRRGAFSKTFGEASREYSEARGGLTLSHWGVTIGIIKDNVIWGNNYHGSNIHGGRNPSFPMLFLQIKPLKWFELNYYHGWLTSDVLDSAQSVAYPGGFQPHLVPKYVAANMYTFKPIRNFYFSVGNSVVYEGNVNPAYFIPFLFYKSVDHGNEQNTNAQLFFDISSRNIKKNHLSFTMYLDEITLRYITDKERHSNWWSFKGSWRYSNFLPNLSFTAEYTYTAPMVYKHFVPTTTYETSSYNMGHYLRDNSQELFVMLDWKPLPRFRAKVHYIFANKGDDYVDDRITRNPNTGLVVVHGLPFQDNIIWSKQEIGFGVQYELVNGLNLGIDYAYMDFKDDSLTYTAPYFLNSKHNVSFKLNVGF
ncbi:MAG: opacity protein-like surface antigen [Bacteroidia bacterium]|jgi:opacity protein-like surface antigen